MTDFRERLFIFNVPAIILALADYVIDPSRNRINTIDHLQYKTDRLLQILNCVYVSNLQSIV